MKKLLLTILGIIILIPQISFAEDEIVWELEGVGLGIGDIIVSNTQNTFLNTYNNSYPIVQIRSNDNGLVLDSINFKNNFKSIDKISITNDDRFMAVSGDGPNLIIWDLENNREYKRFSRVIYEGFSAESWKSASISPDGTKVTAIAVREFSLIFTELITFDIESGEILFSEKRNTEEKINWVQYSPKWQSTEFSPSGEYLVTELSVNWDHKDGQVVLDSVYVYNTFNFDIKDVFKNNHSEKDITFSSYENVISSRYGKYITIYNLENNESHSILLERQPYSILFSRTNSSKILLSLGTRAYIYDYINENEIYKYNNNIYAKVILKDDSKVIGHGINGLTCLNSYWTKTSVENNNNQITISPNPTSSLVNLDLNCSEVIVDYQINDVSGATVAKSIIANQSRNLQLDFSAYATGVYFLTINCKEPKTYKIIKE